MSPRMQLEDVTFFDLEDDGAHFLKKRTRGCTPTGSCESDEMHEEVTPFRAPGSPDPLIEETRTRSDACATWMPDRRDRESGEPLAPEVLSNEGHKAVEGNAPLNLELERGAKQQTTWWALVA